MPDVGAHEGWILTPSEMMEWNNKPKPLMFTQWSLANILVLTFAFLFTLGWVRLGQTGAKELFPDLQVRLRSYGHYAALILRFTLSWALVTSALGLEPRVGNSLFSSPTLFAPDLELRLLADHWMILQPIQLLLATMFFFGIYVRFAAIIAIAVAVLGLFLFQLAMFTYFTAILGIAIYLLMQGAGSHYIPMPVINSSRPIISYLENLPRQRAQYLLRVLAGLNFLYAGVYFKVLQPNLALGIINIYDVPILSANPELFVLIMAVVETLAGIFLLLGILMRPMSLFLLSAFFFFAAMLPESFTAHMLFYGVMLTFWFNSAGYWPRPIAKDKQADIVIIGNSFSAISAALKLNALLGQYTKVTVTIVTQSNQFEFKPLFAEVLSGSIQPGTVVYSLRRVLERANVVVGKVRSIDSINQVVHYENNTSEQQLPYDQLILAQNSEVHLSIAPGAALHGLAFNSMGDALHIRQAIVNVLEERIQNNKQGNISFIVLGNTYLGATVALELGQFIKVLLVGYDNINLEDIRIQYIDSNSQQSALEDERNTLLNKHGIEVSHQSIESVAKNKLRTADKELAYDILINCVEKEPLLVIDGHVHQGEIASDNRGLMLAKNHIYVAGVHSVYAQGDNSSAPVSKLLGDQLAYNAWASSQQYLMKPVSIKPDLFPSYFLARNTFIKVGPLVIGNVFGWCISRYQCIRMLPGLERNLRMILDWLLDIPFRNDTAVLTPEVSNQLEQVRYMEGDVLIKQGDQADCAFIVQSGKLSVWANGNQVAKLKEHDVVGEMALINNAPRAATVICDTDVIVTKISPQQFEALYSGFSVINNAIMNQVNSRQEQLNVTQ